MVTEAPPRWSVAIVIPAHEERDTIARCIRAVVAACDHIAVRAQTWVVVVADACTDGTAQLARRTLGARGEVLECAHRSSGTARQAGTAAALAHFHRPAPHADPRRIWIANTDADTIVPPEWLGVHLQFADQGVGALAGIVAIDPADAGSEVIRHFHATYRVEPDGTHGHVHGANVGVRADAYLAVGGWSYLALAEDHCLWNRLRRHGCHVRSSTRSVVRTSGRLQGRAKGGFADTLRAQLRSLDARA
jgi:cellulose synthase/poly-beta-1,6-N-acetylglucosamine synthase-like glycosyltransferase